MYYYASRILFICSLCFMLYCHIVMDVAFLPTKASPYTPFPKTMVDVGVQKQPHIFVVLVNKHVTLVDYLRRIKSFCV